MEADPKRVAAWLVAIVVPLIAGMVLIGLIKYVAPQLVIEIIKEHFAATVGLPMAALLSAFIVTGLRHTEGPIKFEGLGFKFEGASGQVVLWIFCFLSIAAAIRLLWSVG